MATINDYYSAYVLSYDGCRLKLNLVSEKESLEEIVDEVPIFQEYMDDLFCFKPFELNGMMCTSIAVYFNEYGTYCYHENTNLMVNSNIGIQKIYRDYDGNVIVIFKKFYITSIEKLYFAMDVPAKNGYKFVLIEACFDE